jgi:hypothetical protein
LASALVPLILLPFLGSIANFPALPVHSLISNGWELSRARTQCGQRNKSKMTKLDHCNYKGTAHQEYLGSKSTLCTRGCVINELKLGIVKQGHLLSRQSALVHGCMVVDDLQLRNSIVSQS